MFGHYLQEVLSTGWGIFFFIAGAVSTLVTFILIYQSRFVLPYWVPGALSIAAWLIAPYRLYRKQQVRIEALEAQQQQRRRSVLVLKKEPGSYYIRLFSPHGITPRIETGVYLELVISIENKGERPATISRYDLRIDGMGEFMDQHPSPQSYVIGRTSQHALNVMGIVTGYIEVPAERLAAHRPIPFMLNVPLPPDLQKMRCELTVTDTEENSATAELDVDSRG
jgi:hypothetical protein